MTRTNLIEICSSVPNRTLSAPKLTNFILVIPAMEEMPRILNQ